MKTIGKGVAYIISFFIVFFFFGAFVSVSTPKTIEAIHSNTAHDYWNQSITAYNHRDTMQSCVLMGIAKAAALSAHDNAFYEKTLAEERSICAEAGLTR